VAWDVLGLGRFVAGTFCSWDVLELGPLALGHFVLGRFDLGRFVGVPKKMPTNFSLQRCSSET
jgi:hypothetical protein